MVDAPIVAGLSGHSSPAANCVAVTPNDSTEVNCRALYIGTSGDLAIVPLGGDGTTVTFVNVPIGWFPVMCAKVMAATTADDIVALY